MNKIKDLSKKSDRKYLFMVIATVFFVIMTIALFTKNDMTTPMVGFYGNLILYYVSENG